MYVLKYGDGYLKNIDNKDIFTTEKLRETIIFEEKEEAQELLDFINVYNKGYYDGDYTIYEIDFKEVE